AALEAQGYIVTETTLEHQEGLNLTAEQRAILEAQGYIIVDGQIIRVVKDNLNKNEALDLVNNHGYTWSNDGNEDILYDTGLNGNVKINSVDLDLGHFGVITKELDVSSDFESNFLVIGDVNTNGHSIGSTSGSFSKDEADVLSKSYYTGKLKGNVNLHDTSDTVERLNVGNGHLADTWNNIVEAAKSAIESIKQDNSTTLLQISDNNTGNNTEFNTRNGKVVISVNVNGDTFDFYNYKVNGIQAGPKGIGDPENIIFDFGDFSGVINAKEFSGIIFAPNATVQGCAGSCEGQVICKSLKNDSGEWHSVSAIKYAVEKNTQGWSADGKTYVANGKTWSADGKTYV
ncbi:MAG: choice-of-anchor A family protein, partial [Bacillota bacterium]|nr:choice-of-anchor A family protein [Bacillota bacterium]